MKKKEKGRNRQVWGVLPLALTSTSTASSAIFLSFVHLSCSSSSLCWCCCRELTWLRRFAWRNLRVLSWSFSRMQTLCLSRWFWRRMAARISSQRSWQILHGLMTMADCLWGGGSRPRSHMDATCAAWTCAKVSFSFFFFPSSFYLFIISFLLSSWFSTLTFFLSSSTGQDLARYLEGRQFERKIYIGDSKNDHCPSTRLSK